MMSKGCFLAFSATCFLGTSHKPLQRLTRGLGVFDRLGKLLQSLSGDRLKPLLVIVILCLGSHITLLGETRRSMQGQLFLKVIIISNAMGITSVPLKQG
jgi:hypothetical protein